MEDTRTPEEREATKENLEKRKRAYKGFRRVRRALQITTLVGAGLFAKSTGANAQGFHYEPVNTTQTQGQTQTPRELIKGTPEWAASKGFVREPRFEAWLNRRGMLSKRTGTWEHHGYASAWIHPVRGKVIFLPKEPVLDRQLAETEYSIETVKRLQDRRKGPFEPSNVSILGRIMPRGTYRHSGWRY